MSEILLVAAAAISVLAAVMLFEHEFTQWCMKR